MSFLFLAKSKSNVRLLFLELVSNNNFSFRFKNLLLEFPNKLPVTD